MQGPRSRPLGARRKERGRRLAWVDHHRAKIPQGREMGSWDGPTVSQYNYTGSLGMKASVPLHRSAWNSSDPSHPGRLSCSREALMPLSLPLLKVSEQLQLSFWVARSTGATLQRRQPSKECSMTRGSRHRVPLFLPVQTSTAVPSHPTAAAELCRAVDFPYTARGQPHGVRMPSFSTAKDCGPVQGTLLIYSDCPSNLV